MALASGIHLVPYIPACLLTTTCLQFAFRLLLLWLNFWSLHDLLKPVFRASWSSPGHLVLNNRIILGLLLILTHVLVVFLPALTFGRLSATEMPPLTSADAPARRELLVFKPSPTGSSNWEGLIYTDGALAKFNKVHTSWPLATWKALQHVDLTTVCTRTNHPVIPNVALWPAGVYWVGADVIGPNGSSVTQKWSRESKTC